jgi:hypothetical protein
VGLSGWGTTEPRLVPRADLRQFTLLLTVRSSNVVHVVGDGLDAPDDLGLGLLARELGRLVIWSDSSTYFQ